MVATLGGMHGGREHESKRRCYERGLRQLLGLTDLSRGRRLDPPALVLFVTASEKPVFLDLFRSALRLTSEDVFDLPRCQDYVDKDM